MHKKKIIVASDNKHKLEEIKEILKDLPVSVLSKSDVGLGELEVEEDGETLEQNAIKKAKEISDRIEGIVIADDTGLFVDVLDGSPGVYSSRYAGENVTYEDNNEKLLKELEGVPLEERTARFRTVVAIVYQDKSVKTVEGICEGKIGFERKGTSGFGYDPLFIVNQYNKTFAELGEEIKNNISHRANALIKLREELVNDKDD